MNDIKGLDEWLTREYLSCRECCIYDTDSEDEESLYDNEDDYDEYEY